MFNINDHIDERRHGKDHGPINQEGRTNIVKVRGIFTKKYYTQSTFLLYLIVT